MRRFSCSGLIASLWIASPVVIAEPSTAELDQLTQARYAELRARRAAQLQQSVMDERVQSAWQRYSQSAPGQHNPDDLLTLQANWDQVQAAAHRQQISADANSRFLRDHGADMETRIRRAATAQGLDGSLQPPSGAQKVYSDTDGHLRSGANELTEERIWQVREQFKNEFNRDLRRLGEPPLSNPAARLRTDAMPITDNPELFGRVERMINRDGGLMYGDFDAVLQELADRGGPPSQLKDKVAHIQEQFRQIRSHHRETLHQIEEGQRLLRNHPVDSDEYRRGLRLLEQAHGEGAAPGGKYERRLGRTTNAVADEVGGRRHQPSMTRAEAVELVNSRRDIGVNREASLLNASHEAEIFRAQRTNVSNLAASGHRAEAAELARNASPAQRGEMLEHARSEIARREAESLRRAGLGLDDARIESIASRRADQQTRLLADEMRRNATPDRWNAAENRWETHSTYRPDADLPARPASAASTAPELPARPVTAASTAPELPARPVTTASAAPDLPARPVTAASTVPELPARPVTTASTVPELPPRPVVRVGDAGDVWAPNSGTRVTPLDTPGPATPRSPLRVPDAGDVVDISPGARVTPLTEPGPAVPARTTTRTNVLSAVSTGLEVGGQLVERSTRQMGEILDQGRDPTLEDAWHVGRDMVPGVTGYDGSTQLLQDRQIERIRRQQRIAELEGLAEPTLEQEIELIHQRSEERQNPDTAIGNATAVVRDGLVGYIDKMEADARAEGRSRAEFWEDFVPMIGRMSRDAVNVVNPINQLGTPIAEIAAQSSSFDERAAWAAQRDAMVQFVNSRATRLNANSRHMTAELDQLLTQGDLNDPAQRARVDELLQRIRANHAQIAALDDMVDRGYGGVGRERFQALDSVLASHPDPHSLNDYAEQMISERTTTPAAGGITPSSGNEADDSDCAARANLDDALQRDKARLEAFKANDMATLERLRNEDLQRAEPSCE